MTENELRQLEHLLKKYRSAFAWELTHTKKDAYSQASDEMLKLVRRVITNGCSYLDKDFEVKA
jgi:hypothetical protein